MAATPYFLYAVSNAGSLLALIAYPLYFEPAFGVSVQSRLWLYGYGFLVTMVALSAVLILRLEMTGRKDEGATDDDGSAAPTWALRGRWLAAAFVPSALMLAVTNHITSNLASAMKTIEGTAKSMGLTVEG